MHMPHAYPSPSPVPPRFRASRWRAGSQRGLPLTVHLMKNLHRKVERWLMATRGSRCAFEQQYVGRGRSLSICPSIHTRSSGGDVGVRTLLPCHAEPTIAPSLPPLQPSDMQAPLYLLRFHYPGCLFRHSNVSVAY